MRLKAEFLHSLKVIDSRKRRTHQPESASTADGGTQPPGASLFEEKSRTKAKSSAPGKSRLSLAELKALEEEREREVVLGYKRVEELWLRMLQEGVEAEREWMIEAEKLVEMFRETRNLFVTTRVRMGYTCTHDEVINYFRQDHDFKGMFPKRRIQRRDDADEDRMASRLELNGLLWRSFTRYMLFDQMLLQNATDIVEIKMTTRRTARWIHFVALSLQAG